MKCLYKNRLGLNGEMIARQFLSEKKFKFIRNNYRFERAEIDLIFEDEQNRTLLFVEVKTRRNKNYGEPEESITKMKQNHIRKAALGFVYQNEEYANHDLRIDVISIFFEKNQTLINHIENAF